MQYYGTRLSENISKREPEGYLLCLNVPVARTGMQEYLPEELGLATGPPEMGRRGQGKPAHPNRAGFTSPLGPTGMIPVYRPEEEVFSPETIASFEGMPVTNDHPPDGVDIGNIRALQKGHAHNVRRGSGAESDLLLADLIITDPVLIELILGGKREISCGYTYELHEENGKYIQRKIRGNHVAVVDAGRAGKRVSIRDREPGMNRVHGPFISSKHNSERRTHKMKKSLSKILARMAKDGDIETVAEIIEEMMEPETAETPAEAVAEAIEVTAPVAEAAAAAAAAAENEETEMASDEATLADIVTRLDRIIELLTPGPASDEDPMEEIAEAVEEAMEAAAAEEEVLPDDEPEVLVPEDVAEIVEEILEPIVGETVSQVLDPAEDEDEDEEQEVLSTGDALRAALKAVRPALMKMPTKQRQRVCADIAARVNKAKGRKTADSGIYAALARRKGRGMAEDPTELGKRIMAKRNVNYRK